MYPLPRILPASATLLLAGALALLSLPYAAPAANAQSLFTFNSGQGQGPLVLVVHGVGGGNRPDGWSADHVRKWNIGEVREVTFRQDGRDGTSDTDFARLAGDWALAVRRQIDQAVAENPGRQVVVVSHSWGSVATAMALNGGGGGGSDPELVRNSYQVDATQLGGGRIAEWITLGSPIGGSMLPLLNVQVEARRPNTVDRWTNFYDVDDPVSKPSQNLPGTTNTAVRDSGGTFDFFGIGAHRGVWVNPAVIRHLQDTVSRLRATPPPSTPPSRSRTGDPGIRTLPPAPPGRPAADTNRPSTGGTRSEPAALDYSPVCQSAMTAIERHFRANWGAEFVRIDWTPPLHWVNGACEGGYTVWAKKAGDTREFAPLIWNADTGKGRLTPQDLIQTYAKNNPDLTWTPTSRGGAVAPRPAAGQPDYAATCRSAMTAIERHFANNWGSEFLRVEWNFPFRYDNGACVGGYTVWAQKAGQNQPFSPMSWNAETGTGRIPLQGLIQEYGAKNPDLTWVAPR